MGKINISEIISFIEINLNFSKKFLLILVSPHIHAYSLMKISNLLFFLLERKADFWKNNQKATRPKPNHVVNSNPADKV